jgi:outer membrane protein assembly factor BamE (lipoprotein component of BamABCDE complex)
MLLTGCAVPGKKAQPNIRQIAGVSIGTDKAEVVKMFGAPLIIEIEAKKFRYIYVRDQKEKVIINFDENNKVASVAK